MRDVNRRRLMTGAAAWCGIAAGVRPGMAQWSPSSPQDDADPDGDSFYDTRSRAGRAAGGRRGTDLRSAEPYDDGLTNDPSLVEPYGPRPTGTRPTPGAGRQAPALGSGPVRSVDYARAYAAMTDEPFPVPAVRWSRFNPAFLRQPIAYSGAEPPGTIIIDPHAHHLTYVEPGGRAMRYGVGVGRQGFAWSGVATINSKQEWPDWYPPKEMLARQRDLARQMSELQSGLGMHGGPGNPLGARALYLWQNGKDTLYRIHGTVEPYSIGTSVSSGCIRMINQDAIDLYQRVSVGTRVVVLG